MGVCIREHVLWWLVCGGLDNDIQINGLRSIPIRIMIDPCHSPSISSSSSSPALVCNSSQVYGFLATVACKEDHHVIMLLAGSLLYL